MESAQNIENIHSADRCSLKYVKDKIKDNNNNKLIINIIYELDIPMFPRRPTVITTMPQEIIEKR